MSDQVARQPRGEVSRPPFGETTRSRLGETSHPRFGDTVSRRPVVTVPPPVGAVVPDPTRPYIEEQPHHLALSENPFPPLPSVLRALNRVMAQANRYPEFLPQRLPRLIAEHDGVAPEQVIVGAGGTGVAMQILQALTVGDQIVSATPTFDGYPIMAGMLGLDFVGVPLVAGCQQLSALADAVTDRTRLVVVCRPHNPTGTLVDADELTRFLEQVRVPVLLDEAYVEFVGAAHAVDAVDLVRRYPNVLVLRTFSKAYGLAGLRIGYAFGAAAPAAQIRRLQLPFGMNSAAVDAVRASYAAEHELRTRLARITTEREHLRNMLRRMGFDVPRSHANFLYINDDVAARLHRAGIRAKTYPDGSARIAVGDPESSAAVVRALRTRT